MNEDRLLSITAAKIRGSSTNITVTPVWIGIEDASDCAFDALDKAFDIPAAVTRKKILAMLKLIKL